jgi:hypothetical protein
MTKENKMKYTLINQITKVANGIKCRHYQSQPMSKEYSKPFRFLADNPGPSQMQEAFLNTIVKSTPPTNRTKINSL